MMDELEFLKKDWQHKELLLPKLSYDEIYRMLWKKSSSIVRWILIISILEFALPHLLYLIPSVRGGIEIYDNLGLKNLIVASQIFSYLVVFYFIFQFYTHYKKISVLDDAKSLMSKIIKTRRTVKHYVIFCLSMLLVTYVMVIVGIYLNENLAAAWELGDKAKEISPEKLKYTMMVTIAIIGVLSTLLMGGIYFLLYGLLLRKLKRNYHELERLEI